MHDITLAKIVCVVRRILNKELQKSKGLIRGAMEFNEDNIDTAGDDKLLVIETNSRTTIYYITNSYLFSR